MTESVSVCSSCRASNDNNAMFCLQCGEPMLEGRVAGSYRLLSRMGAGGMGAVYKAEHVRLGTPFAVKLLHSKFAKDKRVVARFLREAKATSQLQHEHIVFLADYGEVDAFGPYIAMEFLVGEPLSARLQNPVGLSLRQIHVIANQICDAMHYSHQQGMVHRDLKPDNIFMMKRDIGQDPFIKVLDFGIAKVTQEDSQQLTSTGAVLGTPSYMAPEQGTGQRADHLVDIYALSTMVYQMCTGHLPFVGDSIVEILSQRMYKDAPLLSVDLPELKDTLLEAIVAQGLQREKEQRIPSMREFKEKLQQSYEALAKRWSSKELELPITELLRSQSPSSAKLPFRRPETADSGPPVLRPNGEKKVIHIPSQPGVSGFEPTTPPPGSLSACDESEDKPHTAAAGSALEQSSLSRQPDSSERSRSLRLPTPSEECVEPENSTMMLSGENSGIRPPGNRRGVVWGSVLVAILALSGLSWALFAPGRKHSTPLPSTPKQMSAQTNPPNSQAPQPRRVRPSIAPSAVRTPRPAVPERHSLPAMRRTVVLSKRRAKRRRQPQRRVRQRRARPVVRKVRAVPRRPVARKTRVAMLARPQDGCPANQDGQRWVRLLVNFGNVEVQAGGKRLRRNRQAGGWCIPISRRRISIEVDGTANNLALCSFSLTQTSRRTIRIFLKDSDDQSPGAYCWKDR